MLRSIGLSIVALASAAGSAVAQVNPEWNICVPNTPPEGCTVPLTLTGLSRVNSVTLGINWTFVGPEATTFAALARAQSTYFRSATCGHPFVSLDSGRISSRGIGTSGPDPCDNQSVQNGVQVFAQAMAPDGNIASDLACGIFQSPGTGSSFSVLQSGSGNANLSLFDSFGTRTYTFEDCGSVQGSASDEGRSGFHGAFRMTIPPLPSGQLSSFVFNFSAGSFVERSLMTGGNCSQDGTLAPIGARVRVEARLNGAVVRSFIAESSGSVMSFSAPFSSDPGELTFSSTGPSEATVQLGTSPGVWTIRVYSIPDVGTAGRLATCFDGDSDPTNDIVNVADISDTDGQVYGLPDGIINSGDYSAFFEAFFSPDDSVCRWVADIADTDGVPGPDGAVDNGDFNAFFAGFFAGCP